jgi:hypothetical protein
MRFIIREQDFEKPLAAGKLQYQQYGRPTGVEETWRLTEVVDGYRFLRIDLDAREAGSEESDLFHLTLSPEGLPVRLKFRSYGPQMEIMGDMLFETSRISVSRTVNGIKFEKDLETPNEQVILMPGTIGLGLAAAMAEKMNGTKAIMLDKNNFLAPSLIYLEVSYDKEELMVVTGQNVPARPCSIRFSNRDYKIWLDDHGWPVKMVQSDGLLAMESSYVRYRPEE